MDFDLNIDLEWEEPEIAIEKPEKPEKKKKEKIKNPNEERSIEVKHRMGARNIARKVSSEAALENAVRAGRD